MNRVYVFTSTGNGLKISREIEKKLGNTQVLSITKVMREGNWTIEGDSVGIIFPCYYGTAPKMVIDFIKKAESIESKYIYSLVTSGGSSGYSLTHIREALESRGRNLNYGDKHIIATNYMNGWYYDMISPDRETLESRLSMIEPFCQRVVEHIKSNKNSNFKDSYMEYLIPRLLSPNRYIKDTRPWDREFSIDSSCSGCSTCEKVCPVNNITMENKRPKFSGNCQRCMACIQFCPKKAYSIKGKPMNKRHYSHPEVSISDLFTFHN